MSNKNRTHALTSHSFSIPAGVVRKIEGDAFRQILAIRFEKNSGGFDVALVGRGVAVQEHNYMNSLGNAAAGARNYWEITNGHSGDIYIRDTNNAGTEVVEIISDVEVTELIPVT